MQTHNLKGKVRKSLSVIIFGSLLCGATFAFAAVTPTVTTTIENSSNAIVTSAPIGSSVSDSVTVASSTGSTPTGTVDFSLYSNTSCSGTPTTQSGVSLVNGSALSSTTTVPNTGLSYLVNYDGDDNYAATAGTCEPLTAIATSGISVSTTLSSTSVAVGSSVYDSATLGNVTANAGGAVSYTVYTDNACSIGAASAGIEPVTNGIAVDSGNFQFNTPGTYYWQALYSGDTNNAPASSPCGSEVLTVMASSTTGTTTTSGSGSISGTVYNDLNRDGIFDNNEPTLSGWTINLYDNANWSGPTNIAPFMTTVSGTNGTYSFTNLPDGTYSIEEINQPAGLNQFTSDYASVVISGGNAVTNENFGNVAGNPYGNGSQNNQNGKQPCATSTASTTTNGGQGYKNQGNQGSNNGNQGHAGFGSSFFGDIQNVVKSVSNHGGNHK